MPKKPPIPGPFKPTPTSSDVVRTWNKEAHLELLFYARSLQKAARTLIAKLDPNPSTESAWDVGPIIVLYRNAVELNLKALVGEGSNFLPTPTDPLTLHKTHSLRWLAQIVCQIIKAVEWESEFKCEDVASLADFSAMVNELEALDPVACAVRSVSRDGSVPPQLQPPNVVQFAKKLDGLIDLLDATADALAATWDQQVSGEHDLPAVDKIKPTIH